MPIQNDILMAGLIWICFILAILRSLWRIGFEGWTKTLCTVGLVGGVLALRSIWPIGQLALLAVGLFCLWVLTRPARLVRLHKRVARVTSKVTTGLGLSCTSVVIPAAVVSEVFGILGVDENDGKKVINAFAHKDEVQHYVMVTPATAELPEEELYFVVAHEVGHHVLGHTSIGMLDRALGWFQSTTAHFLTLGVGSMFIKILGRQRSQAHEYAADAFALERLQDLGIRPHAALRFFDRIGHVELDSMLKAAKDKLFGTHPPPHARKERLDKLMR